MTVTISEAQAHETAGPVAPEVTPRADYTIGSYLENVTARELMTPGVVTIVEDASLRDVFRAMSTHGKHAILVLGRERGKPLGWITHRGLLAWVESDAGLVRAREAITESPTAVHPSASGSEALSKLSQAGTSHLLVTPFDDALPEGTISEMDFLRLAGS